jgi:hypothetical protein
MGPGQRPGRVRADARVLYMVFIKVRANGIAQKI